MRRSIVAVGAALASALALGALYAQPLARVAPGGAGLRAEVTTTAEARTDITLNLPLVLHGVQAPTPTPVSPTPVSPTPVSPTPVSPTPVSPTPVTLPDLSWTLAEGAPRNLYEAQGVAVDGKLYVFGGFYNSQIQATTESHVYDPQTDAWTRIADMPEAITHGGTAVDGHLIYIAGGFVGDHPGPHTDHVWIYDTLQDSWAAGPPLPDGRAGGALVRLGRTLHFFGGTQRQGYTYIADYGDHWALDLDGGTTWEPRAALPNPRNHMAGVAFDGMIYALGGQHLGDEIGGNQATVEMYDPSVDEWTPVADLPQPLGHIQSSTFVWKGRMIVVGGITVGKEIVRDVIAYESSADSWEALTPLPRGYQSPAAAAIDEMLVVSGGGETWIGTAP
jgi:N-acetylneuraminic acid mutarotase